MSNTKTVMGQASNTLAKPPVNVEDVFSTYLYEGNGSTQTITNGIDLDGEGGLVWVKARTATYDHFLHDTNRGALKYLSSNWADAEQTNPGAVSSFNPDGFSFTLTNNGAWNVSGQDYASWTFRKAPKFFDVVTWTGDGTSNRQISHGLNSAVGFITIKRTDSSTNWASRHRSLGENFVLNLNSSAATFSSGTRTLTSNYFTVGNGDTLETNASGGTYVAYLFAHNDGDGEFGPDGDADIIKCGSYTGNGNYTTGNEVDVGFEPQWVMIKNASRTDGNSDWVMYDTMRGFTATNEVQPGLFANLSDAETASGGKSYQSFITTSGFTLMDSNEAVNFNGDTYIYIAIRRGTKVPESASEVFAPVAQNTTSTPLVTTGFPVDLAILTSRSGQNRSVVDRLRGSTESSSQRMFTNATNAETSSGGGLGFDNNTGYKDLLGGYSDNILWNWKRAPGYFDAVAYTGDGVAGRTVSHNLGVAPEMIISKKRSGTQVWGVGVPSINSGQGYLKLNEADPLSATSYTVWSNITATSYTVNADGLTNASGSTYINYLFASLPGISKVGSFSHTSGTATDVDCGFSSGARFVLWKEVNALGDWSVFDTTRGIVSGNDAELTLNTTAAESSLDKIDPLSSGFTVSASVYNDSGDYIFYAIA